MIMSSQSWWEGLPRLQLGWDVLEVAREQGYRIMILTQGPNRYPSAWSGKKLWIDRNLGPGTDVTITRDKGLVYGRVLVDDRRGGVPARLRAGLRAGRDGCHVKGGALELPEVHTAKDREGEEVRGNTGDDGPSGQE